MLSTACNDRTRTVLESAHIQAIVHALRHLRASELVGFYGFDGFNLATYGGWTYHTLAQTTPIMDKYLSLSWQGHFAKLLKRR